MRKSWLNLRNREREDQKRFEEQLPVPNKHNPSRTSIYSSRRRGLDEDLDRRIKARQSLNTPNDNDRMAGNPGKPLQPR